MRSRRLESALGSTPSDAKRRPRPREVTEPRMSLSASMAVGESLDKSVKSEAEQVETAGSGVDKKRKQIYER